MSDPCSCDEDCKCGSECTCGDECKCEKCKKGQADSQSEAASTETS